MILEDKKGVSLLITQIKKRDGEIVNYDSSKIFRAIEKAANETNDDIELLSLVTVLDEVEEGIEKIEGIVTVECIQDLVEDALLNNHHTSVAKAYIQYRERQRQKRQRDLFEKRTAMKPYEYPEFKIGRASCRERVENPAASGS